jgi:hypothetical protein
MPAALYTISHKTTRSVLAVVSLEKKALTDAAAWDGFRKQLLGDDKLTLPVFGAHKTIALAVDQLAVDEVDADAATTRLLYEDPYKYEVVTTPEALEPGDGTKKSLNTPGNRATPSLATTGTLTITLANMPTDPMPVWVVFEGQGPKSVTITAPNTTAIFTVSNTTLPTNTPYTILVLARGAPVFYGIVRT